MSRGGGVCELTASELSTNRYIRIILKTVQNQLKTDTMGQVSVLGGQNPDLPYGRMVVKG